MQYVYIDSLLLHYVIRKAFVAELTAFHADLDIFKKSVAEFATHLQLRRDVRAEKLDFSIGIFLIIGYFHMSNLCILITAIDHFDTLFYLARFNAPLDISHFDDAYSLIELLHRETVLKFMQVDAHQIVLRQSHHR